MKAVWKLVLAPGQHGFDGLIDQFDPLLELEGQILLNKRRSFVKRLLWQGHDLVIKQPKAKDKSVWTRFTTLYRISEVMSQFKSLILLNHIGVKAVTPVLVAEKRLAGFVVDSRLLYFFQEGKAISEQRYPDVVKQLQKIHEHGYVHKDPHIDNFIQYNDAVVLIDSAVRRCRFGPLDRAYNWRRLCHRRGEEINIQKNIPIDTQSFSYRVADLYFNLKQRRVKFKRAVRKTLGLQRKS